MDPIYQVRLGVERLFVTSQWVLPLRLGIFYDPAPAKGSLDDFFGLSIGDGERFAFDMAYQYRFGNNVRKFMLDGFDFSQDVREHIVYASVIIYSNSTLYKTKNQSTKKPGFNLF